MSPPLVHCTSCFAQIYYCDMETGGRMPVDAKPTPAGNIIFIDKKGHVLHKDETPPVDAVRWTSHFATCTKPKQHRKPRGKRLIKSEVDKAREQQ